MIDTCMAIFYRNVHNQAMRLYIGEVVATGTVASVHMSVDTKLGCKVT